MPETKTRGRPKSKSKMEQITIKLPPKMINELRELSNKSYNPMSYHIHQAIAEYLKRNNDNYKKLNFYFNMDIIPCYFGREPIVSCA